MDDKNKIEILQAIHEIHITQTRMESILERNTDELEIHIKRTNLLEQQVRRVFMFALLAAGFVAAKFGTEILKILGVIL